jgi:hypothetical protein
VYIARALPTIGNPGTNGGSGALLGPLFHEIGEVDVVTVKFCLANLYQITFGELNMK